MTDTWTHDEIRRFWKGYHKFGPEFDKISKFVGGGKGPTMCEALFRRHQAYLSLDKKFQSDVAFIAMVEDAINKPEDPDDYSDDNDEGFAAIGKRKSLKSDGNQYEDDDDEEYPSDDEEEDAKQGGYNSPTRSHSIDAGAHALTAAAALASPRQQQGTTLAASRPRRTPKRPIREAGMSRTPISASKRARAGGRDDDIYEFYDAEGAAVQAITDSARKRRAAAVARDTVSNRKLEFGGGVGRRAKREDLLDDERAVEALFALAGNESLEGDVSASSQDEFEEEEEEEEEGLAMADNESDEDYHQGGKGGRNSFRRKGGGRTPDRNRYRPGNSNHITPRRKGGKPIGGPLGSPTWLDGLGDKTLLDDADTTYQHLTALVANSPGFNGGVGFVPSPQHPLPRLRRRKFPVEQMRPMISPLKVMFSRRQSLSGTAASLLSMTGLGGSTEDSVGPMTPAEASLRHCLHARARKWAQAEFFVSAIDRPWFLENPMQDLMQHMGLGRVGKMKKAEWNIVRSSLGKPRRLSTKFLHEQRAKLQKWRETVREFYAQPPSPDTPPNPEAVNMMPKPPTVGQRVIARHPSTRQLHDGCILTTAHNCYRIQFDRRELGVELIRDIDVMPADPFELLPPAMAAAKPALLLNGHLTVDGKPVRPKLPAGVVRPVQSATTTATAAGGGGSGMLGLGGKGGGGHDIAAMAELAVGLDKKEALINQLRAMNDEAQAGVHSDISGITTQDFAQAYAAVVLGIKDVNENVHRKIQTLDYKPQLDAAAALAVTAEGAAYAAAAQAAGATLPYLHDSNAPDAAQINEFAENIATTALDEARRVTAACKAKLAESAAETAAANTTNLKQEEEPEEANADADGDDANPPPTTTTATVAAPPPTMIDWSTVQGQKLSALVEGAVWLLVMLQQGAESVTTPMNALVAALDVSFEAVKPHAVGNQGLHLEIEEAMKALKAQLLAV